MNAELIQMQAVPEFFLLSLGLSYLIGKEVETIKNSFEMKKAVENKENSSQYNWVGFFEGTLESDSPFWSSLGSRKVIYSRLTKEKIWPIFGQKTEPYFRWTNFAQNLSLQDKRSKQRFLIQQDTRDILEKIKQKQTERFEFKNLTSFQRKLNELLQIFNKSFFGLIWGYSVAIKEEEFTVHLGTPVFLIGILKHKANYKFPFISEVLKITRNLKQMNDEIKQQLTVSAIKLTVFLGAGYFLSKAFYYFHKDLIHQTIKQPLKIAKEFINWNILHKEKKNILVVSNECLKCKQNTPVYYAENCKHLALCEQCYEQQQEQQTCLYCNKVSSKYQKIFIN